MDGGVNPAADLAGGGAGMTLHSARYVRINRFVELTGYTEDAVRAKIKEGIWRERQHYRHAPDGRIVMDMVGYEQWVEGGATA